MMMKKAFLTGMFLVSVILLVSLSSAATIGTQWLCVKEGDVVRFSRCNENAEDKTCKVDNCMYCVTINSQGVVCPANMNTCLNIKGCSYMTDDGAPASNGTGSSGNSSLALESPANGASVPSGPINFVYRVLNPSTMAYCNLTIDNDIPISNKSAISSGSNTISATLGIGTHAWRMTCVTKTNSKISSPVRTIVVTNGSTGGTTPNPGTTTGGDTSGGTSGGSSGGSSGGGGGGGGGGGSSSTSKPKNVTNSTLNQTNLALNVNNEANESEETPDAITGNVAGTTESSGGDKNIVYVVLAAIIAAIIIAGVFISKRKGII
jgi:hypothetical protein